MSILSFCDKPKWTAFGAGKCGKCRGCLKVRQTDWGQRSNAEHAAAVRTWFATFTYAGAAAPGYDELQKLFKRLRKQGFPIRYLVSTEKGDENARVHYHALVHCTARLTRRLLEKEWKHGFSHLRLVKGEKAAGQYVAKYVAKSGGEKLRASIGYGSQAMVVLKDRWIAEGGVIAAIFESFPDAYINRIAGVRTPYVYRKAHSVRRALPDAGAPSFGLRRAASEMHSHSNWLDLWMANPDLTEGADLYPDDADD